MSSPDSSGGMSHSAVRPALFDAYRGVNYDKPRLRGWAHLISFELALVIGTLVIAHASGALHVTAAAIYAGAVVALFGTSALYHRATWGPVASARLQKLDHLMIIYLIAGTATPVIVICLHGTAMVVELTVLWTIALLTAFVRILRMNAPEGVVGALYIGLGWSAGLAIPAVWVHAGVAPALLLIIGGLLYTAGAVSYHRRRPDPDPSVFGYHEVFHAYVSVAAACHYVAIACFVL
jgi:hemolysin III